MQPAMVVNLEAEQGSTFDQPILVLGDNGEPVNFSDIPTNPTPGAPAIPYGVRGQVRKKYSDLTPTLTFVATFSSPEGGAINIHLSAAALAAAAKGQYVYDVEVFYLLDPTDEQSEEIVHKIMKGSFLIDPEATKETPN